MSSAVAQSIEAVQLMTAQIQAVSSVLFIMVITIGFFAFVLYQLDIYPMSKLRKKREQEHQRQQAEIREAYRQQAKSVYNEAFQEGYEKAMKEAKKA